MASGASLQDAGGTALAKLEAKWQEREAEKTRRRENAAEASDPAENAHVFWQVSVSASRAKTRARRAMRDGSSGLRPAGSVFAPDCRPRVTRGRASTRASAGPWAWSKAPRQRRTPAETSLRIQVRTLSRRARALLAAALRPNALSCHARCSVGRCCLEVRRRRPLTYARLVRRGARCADGGAQAEPAALLREATKVVSGLQEQVARATIFLPAYDQRLSSDTVVSLHGEIANARRRVCPKPAFSFKTRKSGALTSEIDLYCSSVAALCLAFWAPGCASADSMPPMQAPAPLAALIAQVRQEVGTTSDQYHLQVARRSLNPNPQP